MRIAAGVLGLIVLLLGAAFLVGGLAPLELNTDNGNPSWSCVVQGQNEQDCSWNGDSPQEATEANGSATRNTIVGGALIVAGATLIAGVVAASGRSQPTFGPPALAYAGPPPGYQTGPGYPPTQGGSGQGGPGQRSPAQH